MSKIVLNKENVILKIAEEGDYAHIVGLGEEAHWECCTKDIALADYENRCATEEKLLDGGIFFPEMNMVMPFSCGANEILEVEVPEGIKAQEYKYENGAFLINAPVRIKNIKKELEALDAIINRATEDLYAATETTAYANVQAAIDRKNVLRAELATLEA